MQNAVIKFATGRENGLCLIDMPTGSGKTYQTRQLIKRYLDGEILESIPMIIYLTPLKKNIDDIYNELRKDFKGREAFFDSNVLRIYANYESVIDSFLRLDDKISTALKSKESYKLLKGKIEQYHRLMESLNVPLEVINTTIKELRKDYEPRFRRDLEEEISRKVKGIKNKKMLLNHEYAWVKEMYPACLSFDRKVLFMTMDKFLSGNDPIIAKPYRFLTHSQTKDALIFIDEFDATKDVILNQEIQDCTDYKLDLARLFSGIATALKGQEFPSQLFEGSDDIDDPKSSRSSFEKMKQKILEIEKQYCLNYLFKLDAADDSDRVFLFDDYQLHTITSTKESGKISSMTDKQKNQNVIYLLDDKHDDKGVFYRSIYGMKGALNYFINCCAMMARNYLNHYNEVAREKRLDQMEIEQAVSTIIDPYNLDRGVANTLSKMIVDNVTIPFVSRQKDILSTDFYMDGFRYFDFKDDISHDASTSFLMCFMNNTPEKMMLSLASKARVVGLSATASIQTVTGNYNIEYLEERLGEQFYHLPDDDLTNIRHEVENRLFGQYRIVVKSEEGVGTEPSEIAKGLFTSPENVERFTGLFEKYISPKDKNNYQLARFAKMILAIKDFIGNPNSKVLLSLTNKNIKTTVSNDAFTEENVSQILNAICDEMQVRVPRIHHLYGNDFEGERETYIQEVKRGERVILFSSYPSVGTGQNLQYEENEGESTVQKDIDSLYIEEPTNIIVNAANLETESDLMKYIYQMETLAKNGELNLHWSMKNIKAAFKKYNAPMSFVRFGNLPYSTVSKNNHALKILIQAVGRICRTKSDRKIHDVNLYVDGSIFSSIDFSLMESRLMNPEFAKIVSYAGASQRDTKEPDEEAIHKLNKANYNNTLVTSRIENIISENRESWSEKDIQQWEMIRQVVLKHPTVSHEKLDKIIRETRIPNLRSFYLEAKAGQVISDYVYHHWDCDKHEDDEDRLEKRFPIRYHFSSKPIGNGVIINAENSRLTALMRIPALKKEFQIREYATDFYPDQMIILPVVYQNIYKGALGEEVGKFLLSQIGVFLQPISDVRKYEKFDFQLVNNEDIYVDFKNWSENDQENRKSYLEKCERKLQVIGGKKVFVINMVASDFTIHDNGRIVEISSLCKPKGDRLLYLYNDSEYIRLFEKFSEVMKYGNN